MEFAHLDIPELRNISDGILDETTESSRFYITPSGIKYPSITTVLSYNPEKKRALREWKARVGHQEAARISRVSSKRGTSLHTICEKYLNNSDDYLAGAMPDAISLFRKMQVELDRRVNNIHAQEIPLYSDVLQVAGRVDCIAEWDGVPSVIDFKTSERLKQVSWISEYFIQGAAYACMYYERTSIPIRQIVIPIGVVESKTAQIFVQKVSDWLKPLAQAISLYRNHVE